MTEASPEKKGGAPRMDTVIVQRWQEETGQAAVLDGEDRTFADVSALRQAA